MAKEQINQLIQEDYVSFETAKLLKEKGFKGEGRKFYEKGKIVDFIDYWHRITPEERYESIEAPTLQMAMKWLRKEKHIFIELLVDTMIKGAFTWRLFEYPSMEIMPYDGWEHTYENACEAAIKYCLENLI